MRSNSDYVQDWFAKAGSDFKIARREASAEDPATDAVRFHFQQAVEKMLKAYLVWRDRPAPKTHNIEVLIDMCMELDESFSALRSVELLTAYAVELRYPDDLYFPSLQEMQQAQEMADFAETFIVERFLRDGIDPWEGR